MKIFLEQEKESSIIKGVIFILQKPDKTVLLQQRDGNSEYDKWSWCFPGGRCEEGEDFADTVIREVFEEYEVVLRPEQLELVGFYPTKENAVYLCAVPQDCHPIMHEGAGMKWVTKEDLQTMELGYNQGGLLVLIEKYL